MPTTSYEIYVFWLCLVVFTALTAMFSYLFYEITKLTIKVIRSGTNDDVLVKSFDKGSKPKWQTYTLRIASIVVCVVLTAILAFSVWTQASENTYLDYPSVKVIASSSMAKKHQKNAYLFDNNLDTQMNMFDLIVTHPVPDEDELQLYDIVVYEYNDMHIIHRIVEIEEPNSRHPDERWFRTQGDAINTPDREWVQYNQIKAIYQGQRVQNIGSFIFFMRSPAGLLCTLLIFVVLFAMPIMEKKLHTESIMRLFQIGHITREQVKALIGVDIPAETVQGENTDA